MDHPEGVINFFDRLQRWGLLVGGGGVLLALLGLLLDRPQFFQSYLFAYLFWLGITLGALALLMVYHLTGGRWGFMLRRILETAALLSILMALLIIPLFFGLRDLYLWARPEVVAADAILQHKRPYLNIPFFIARNILYFLFWGGAAFLLARWSWAQDRTEEHAFELAERMRYFSGPAFAFYGLTVTFAMMDWLMSLEPYWFSTIFGAMIASAQVLTGLAFATIAFLLLARRDPRLENVSGEHIDDLGKLLLAFALFWVYMTFIQYLIIWAGNLPEEVVWYLRRLRQGWQWVAVLVLLLHYIVPFAALLAGQVRKQPRSLLTVAATLFGIDLIYCWWLVAPVFHPVFHVHWLDLVLPCAVGGLWLAAFAWQVRRHPLLPQHDPVWDEIASRETLLHEALAGGNAHE